MVDGNSELVDMEEKDLFKYDSRLLALLLKDNSSKQNILWATDNYTLYGDGYGVGDVMMIPLITGENGNIVKPGVNKNKAEQLSRVRDKAEVFTPSWICNMQNNLVDNAWFGRKDIFNRETNHGWQVVLRPVPFPADGGKSWQDYVQDVRLEITCGEAPYLVSRYDTITGKPIGVSERIGLLDRKLRVVSENTGSREEWSQWATVAFQSTYGFEWQGDSLLLARKNLLSTLVDYHQAKFDSPPSKELLLEIAEVISWNIWQMDGLKGVIPKSCGNHKVTTADLFGTTETEQPCEGCLKGDIHKHNGIYCKIKDWKTGEVLTFVSLLKPWQDEQYRH